MFNGLVGGLAQGQQYREQQDLREADNARRQQEADQMRQMREFQIKNAADEQKMREDLAAIPTTYDEKPQTLTPQRIMALGRNQNGEYFSPEQAEGIRMALANDPASASKFITALAGARPNAPQRNYFVTADENGDLSYGATGIQRSQADIARDQARIMMRRGDPMSALTSQQLVINAHKADRDLIEKRMGEIMSTPLPDQEKANMMAGFLTETSGIPGNFRMLPAEGGKKFALQYVDPATGEVRTDQKPRTLDDIYRDTIKHYSVDNYKAVHGLNEKDAKLPAEVKEADAKARSAVAAARVAEGTVDPKIRAASLDNVQTEARTNLLNSQAGYYDAHRDYLNAGGKAGKANMSPKKMSVRVLRENGKYEPVDVMVSSKDGELTYTRADGSALSAAETNAVNAAWGQQDQISKLDERYTLRNAALDKQLQDPNANYDAIRAERARLEQDREDGIANVYYKGLPTPELRSEALADSILAASFSGRNPNQVASALGATTKEFEAANRIIAERAKAAKTPAGAAAPAKPAQAVPTPAGSSGTNVPNPMDPKADQQRRAREARAREDAVKLEANARQNAARLGGDILYSLKGATTPQGRADAERRARLFFDDERGGKLADTTLRQEIQSELDRPTYTPPRSAVPTNK